MSEHLDQDRIDDIFVRAADLPEEKRAEFLRGACNGNSALVAEVERLLSAHDEAERSHKFLAPLPVNAVTRPKPESGSGCLEVRCPSCHTPIEVAVDTQLTDLTCSSCGSHFSLVDQSMATRMAPSLLKLGRFELIERLGVGGFGSVWKARDKELDRTVAIKIPREGGMTPDEQEKFFREARAAAQLRHPHIVSVHEVGRDGDSVFIVSDFVRGVTLGDWLTSQQLTNREAAELCAKTADALQHAHSQGVVHRDLKPANIMIDPDGNPHLMDFGLARREAGEVTVTVDGHILGTPAYMSPEQAEGRAHTADRRSDVYSLGVILFQLLTGELPFRGNARMIMHQVIRDEPPSPRKLNANVSKDLETITLKCMEKDPVRRYQSAKELSDELRRFLSDTPIQSRPIGPAERARRWCSRNPLLASLSAALFALLITTTIASTWAALKLAAAKRHEATAVRSEYALLAANLRTAIEARDWRALDSATTQITNRFGSLPEAQTLLKRSEIERNALTTTDEQRARSLLEKLHQAQMEDDNLRVHLLLSSASYLVQQTGTWKSSAPEMTSLRNQSDAFLRQNNLRDNVNYLSVSSRFPTALEKQIPAYLKRLKTGPYNDVTDGRYALLRILLEDESRGEAISVKFDNCFSWSNSSGFSTDSNLHSGSLEAISYIKAANFRYHRGVEPAVRIRSFRHRPLDIPIKLGDGDVTTLGTIVLKAIRDQDCGLISITLKPDPQLNVTSAQLSIRSSEAAQPTIISLSNKLETSALLPPGPYELNVDPNEGAAALNSMVVVRMGETTKVEIPIRKPLGRIDLEWRYRVYGSDTTWQSARTIIPATDTESPISWPGDVSQQLRQDVSQQQGLSVRAGDEKGLRLDVFGCPLERLPLESLPNGNETVESLRSLKRGSDKSHLVHQGDIFGILILPPESPKPSLDVRGVFPWGFTYWPLVEQSSSSGVQSDGTTQSWEMLLHVKDLNVPKAVQTVETLGGLSEEQSFLDPPIHELRKFIGTEQTVKFRVLGMDRGDGIYLYSIADFSKPECFAAVIEPDQVAAIGTLETVKLPSDFHAKRIAVTGKLVEDNGLVRIHVTDLKKQLQLIDSKGRIGSAIQK